MSSSRDMMGAALVAVALSLGCASGPRPEVLAPSASAKVCGKNLGPSPFKDPKATHFLVADFDGAPASSEPNFADTVAKRVAQALQQFEKEELPKLDIPAPEGSLEIERLSCFLENHEQAEAAAKALGADVVIWGQANCRIPVPAEGNSDSLRGVAGSEKVSSTVCPKAMLSRSDRDFRRSEVGIDLASIGQLDLPALHATEPSRLVDFALGLHFYELENYWLAARFFQHSAEQVRESEQNTLTLDAALGFAYLHESDFEQSIKHSRRALARMVVSQTSKEAALLNNIGSVLWNQGDLEGALTHYRRALAIDEKALGPDQPTVASLINNIGLVLKDQGDLEGALVHLRRALAIDEKALGSDHPTVARDVSSIGLVLKEQRDLPGALLHFRRALAINEKALGPDHPTVAIDVNNIGFVLKDQGDLPGALGHFRRALAIYEKVFEADDPAIARFVNNIGGVLHEQGDLPGAFRHYRRALAIMENKLGKDHPNTRVIRSNLAIVLAQQNGWAPDGSKGGVVVVRCLHDTCSGLTTGDWITSYGTTKPRDGKHLQELFQKTSPSSHIKLSLVREGKPLTLTVPGGPFGVELL